MSKGTARAKAQDMVVYTGHGQQVRKAREVGAEKKWVGRMLQREEASKRSFAFRTEAFGPQIH